MRAAHLVFCLVVLALAGCQMEAKIAPNNAPATACVDLRDGEKFSFKTKNITDVRYGIGAPSCFSVTDDAGKFRRLCSDQEVYLKCVSAPE